MPAGNYGSCLLGSVQGTSASDSQVPPVGTAFTYFVAGFDAEGQGTLGNSSSGVPRNPAVACIPARRFFQLDWNGTPGDGVTDGREQLINPSALLWSSHRETAGVYLHTGEAFVSAVDLEVVSTRLPLERDADGVRLQVHFELEADTTTELLLDFDAHSGPFVALSAVQARARPAVAPTDDVFRRALDPYCTTCHLSMGTSAHRSSPTSRYRPSGEHSMLAAVEPSYLVARRYRSQIQYDGPLGQGWDSPAFARLAPNGSDAVYFPGTGRREPQVRFDATRFFSRVGRYTYLRQNPDGSFFFRDRDGTIQRFHAFDGSNKEGAIESIEDRHGNRTTFLYDPQGLLTTVVDTLGRTITYAYNADGRVASVTDFSGRSVVYTYDANGDLVSARSPAVTGTPNGNDFPGGKTTTYTYTSGFADDRLNHNLLSIIPPEEQGMGLPTVQNVYGTDPASFHLDRVVAQTIGGTNSSGVPAGGALTFAYDFLNPGADIRDTTIPRRKATVTDRNGNLREYIHNSLGNLLSVTRFTNRNLRPGEPDYTTQFSCNLDGQIVEILAPAGNRALFTYDPPGTGIDRYREGNLLELRLQADTLASGGRGDGHGGEASDLIWSFGYEPVFNQLVSMTDPRGNDAAYVPPNGGPWSPARYTKSWLYDYQEGDPATNGMNAYAAQYEVDLGTFPFNLGDLNGDGSTSQILGNAVKVQDPSVLLAPASNQATIEGDLSQDIVTLYRHNLHGQVVTEIDPEGNRHDFEYYAQTDPDGNGSTTPPPPDGRVLDPVTGGYLKARTLDTVSAMGRDNGTNPTPAMIREDFAYDPVGNLTHFVDGRGVRTRWVVNQLNQVVEVRRAAATADASGPSGDPATGRGEGGLTPLAFLARFSYDANDNVLDHSVEDRGNTRGAGAFIDTTWTYDLLDDPVEVQQQVSSGSSLVTQLRYDANQNRTKVTEPAGNAREWVYDERDLLLSQTRGASGPRGGTPSARTYSYDANGNLAQTVDGRGGLTDILYDGFDRPARRTCEFGNTADSFYDPLGNTVESLLRGPIGGPTPVNRSGSTNVDLHLQFSLFDEMSRPFRIDRQLFVPSGAVPARTPVLIEGPLVPSDGRINTILEYDRLSRPTFVLRDTAATTRIDYDGTGRTLKRTLPGTNLEEYTYDGNGNLVERAETETSSSPGPPAELFLTTFFYDAADRLTSSVDNLGQTRRYLYDSLDALTLRSDARGPVSGSISRRSPGHTGITVPINDHGNVTRYSYDGLGRPLSAVQVLTVSGEGNGTTTPTPDASNPFNPDGLITRVNEWDANSLRSRSVDDRGNETLYAYDNLDRLVAMTADDGTIDQLGYDAEDNLVLRTEPNGTLVSSTYDAAHRLVARSVTPGSGVEGTTQQTFQYDGLSRMTLGTDNNVASDFMDNVTASFIYDSLGRVIEEGQVITDGSPSRTTDLQWFGDALLLDLIYPAGRQIHYTYDAADRLATVNEFGRSESASFQYFGFSRAHTVILGGMVRSTRLDNSGTIDAGYDGAKRTTLLRYLDPPPFNQLMTGFEYRYDRAGNLASHRRLHHFTGPLTFKGEVYAHDSADRLRSFQEGSLNASHALVPPATDAQTWTLDGAGNWPQMNRAGTGFLATPNNNNEYDEPQSGGTRVDDGIPDDFFDLALSPFPDGLNLTHDKNGNETNIGLFSLRYDFLDRAVRAWRNSDLVQLGRYIYDALGRRVKRLALVDAGAGPQGVTRRYYYALSQVIEERAQADVLNRQEILGPDNLPLWQVRNDGTSQYFLRDVTGSTVALVTGPPPSILERVTYDPYGKPTFENLGNMPLMTGPGGSFAVTSGQGNPELFRGLRYDPELGARTTSIVTDLGGLYLTRSLYLDPNKGRYTSREPHTLPYDTGNFYSNDAQVYYRVTATDDYHQHYAEGAAPDPAFEAPPIHPSDLPCDLLEPDWMRFWFRDQLPKVRLKFDPIFTGCGGHAETDTESPPPPPPPRLPAE